MELNYWDAITNMQAVEAAKKAAEPPAPLPHAWVVIDRVLTDYVAEKRNRAFTVPDAQIDAAIQEARAAASAVFHLKARLQEKLQIILPADQKAGE